ncbi:MAG TPA: ATP-binding protein [Nitrospiraceae bacterium]|nr:ATP-binding protein [Nitrospiraceae bacterium]
MMNAFALSGLLTGITSSVLGALVYLKRPDRGPNRLWALFAMAVAVWGFGSYKIALTTDMAAAYWWWKLTHVGVILIPVLFAHFIHVFLDIKRTASIILIYVVGLSFLGMNLFSDLLIRHMRFVFSSFYYDSPPAPAYPYFVAFFFSMIGYGHYQLWKAYRHASGTKKDQIKYFFLATAVGFTGGGTCFLPVFGIDVYPYLNFTVPLYPILMSYAIIRYRLMDISVVINKGVAYVIVLAGVLLASSVGALLNHRMSAYSLPPLMVALLVLACGSWVFLDHPRRATNATFGVLCLGVAAWLIGCFMMFSSADATEALAWTKAIHAGVVFIPAVFYHFCARLVWPGRRDRLITVNYFASAGFLALLSTSWLISGTYRYYWGYYGKAGPLHPLFLVYFSAVCGLGLMHLYHAARSDTRVPPQTTSRMQHTLWAFVIAFVGSVDFIPSYGVEFYPVGYLTTGLWISLVSYTIVKHDLMSVTLPSPQAYGVLSSQFLVLIPTYGATLTIIWLFTGTLQYLMTGVLLGVYVAISGLLANLQRNLEDIIGQRLFRARYDAYDTLAQFSRSLVSILDLQSLTKEVVVTLTKVMKIATASLYVLDSEKRLYVLTASHGLLSSGPLPLTVKADEDLPLALARHNNTLLRGELEYGSLEQPTPSLLQTMKSLDAETCVPLINKERLVGFCNLGPKEGHKSYSHQDLSLLMTLGQHAAIALDNALLYEDLKRSQALMRRTDRLRSLETIAGGFAHEIRNPLTSIKTFIQLVPDRRDDQDFVEKFSEIVVEDVRRIERLIQEILDYARYMEPKLTEENLNDIVASCLYFIQVKASAKSIRIERDFASDLPPVTLDRQQIKQVLLNLFINAMDAMAAQGGCLSVKTHLLRKLHPVPWVQIEVTDTGAGIAPENLDHIFDPFYTTKHASGDHEGTGLGLTIVHQIVHEHHGYIEVTSEVGKGTTFFVNLPASPDPTPPWHPQPWPQAHQ